MIRFKQFLLESFAVINRLNDEFPSEFHSRYLRWDDTQKAHFKSSGYSLDVESHVLSIKKNQLRLMDNVVKFLDKLGFKYLPDNEISSELYQKYVSTRFNVTLYLVWR